MSIRILEGKALSSAIKSAGKSAATFSKLMHEVAYGAILHCEKHTDATYVNLAYDTMPGNYRTMVRQWFEHFGKCSFDAASMKFTYSKGKKSDLETALAVSPADFKKEKAPKDQEKPAFMERVEKLATKAIADVDTTPEDREFARRLADLIKAVRASRNKPDLKLVA